VDDSGSAYITGYTYSTNFPTASPFQETNAGGYDAFLSKLNAAGSSLVYSTYLGGSNQDVGSGVAVDHLGNAYLTGYTYSTDFPIAVPIQKTLGGVVNSFLTKFNPAGSELLYPTYLGGSGYDYGRSIALDPSGNAYITGYTTSPNFPTLNPIQDSLSGNSDAFVSKLNSTGSALVYSTYLGGSSHDYGKGIAVDPAGNAYVVGYTYSSNFPTSSPIQESNAGGYDAFVTKINPAGAELIYSTYLGGSGNDSGWSIAVDGSGNAYLTTGYTSSNNFPLINPIQGSYGGAGDAFVTKIGMIESISTPTIPTGPTFGAVNIPYSYSTGGSISNIGHSVEYQFDWKGDGTDLSQWGSATQSKTWTSIGTYSVRAKARCATDTSVVSEWSETLSVTINQTPLPDLTGQWSSLSQTCNNTLRGTKCSLKGKFTVQNIGNLDASSSTIKFHLSDNNTYNEGDTLLKQFPSGTIMAGGSLTGNIKFNLPSGQTASGKYVIAVIDADNTVTESNESNNQVIYGPIP
jgi:hypothetical protein